MDQRAGGDGLDELCELALSAGWVKDIDEFWRDEPNVDGEYGLTLPRLESLTAAHRSRVTIERYKLGEVLALAFHEPDKLQERYEQAVVAQASQHPLDVETDVWFTPEDDELK